MSEKINSAKLLIDYNLDTEEIDVEFVESKIIHKYHDSNILNNTGFNLFLRYIKRK